MCIYVYTNVKAHGNMLRTLISPRFLTPLLRSKRVYQSFRRTVQRPHGLRCDSEHKSRLADLRRTDTDAYQPLIGLIFAPSTYQHRTNYRQRPRALAYAGFVFALLSAQLGLKGEPLTLYEPTLL